MIPADIKKVLMGVENSTVRNKLWKLIEMEMATRENIGYYQGFMNAKKFFGFLGVEKED